MARDWVKLHTSMLGHAGTMMLPDRAFRLWVILLMMAGMTDDEGRAGTVAEVAFNLRTDEADANALLTALNGRAVVRDGVVYVRDWSEWQPKQDPTAAKRQADFRARHADEVEALRAAAHVVDIPPRDVTPLRNDVTNAATRAQDSPTHSVEPVDPTGTTQSGVADASPAPAEPHWAGGSAAFNDIADALAVWLDVNPTGLHPATQKALKQAARIILHRGFSAEHVTLAEELWYSEHWRGKDAKRTDVDRRPNVREAQDWFFSVDHRVRPEPAAVPA